MFLDKPRRYTYSRFPLSYTSKGLSPFSSTDHPPPSRPPFGLPTSLFLFTSTAHRLPPQRGRPLFCFLLNNSLNNSVTTLVEMGCVQSSAVDSEAKASWFRSLPNIKSYASCAIPGNDEIESQLKKDRIMAKNEIKMLLLGAGESGKVRIPFGLSLNPRADPPS